MVVTNHLLWSQWTCILKWLYKKKWHPKLKLAEIDRDKASRDSLEPFADLLHSALLVCEQCFLYGNISSYSHHLYWFKNIALELRVICFDCPKGKEALVKRLRKYAEDISVLSNPFDATDCPALWELIEVAIELSNSPNYKGFRAKYLVKKKSKAQRGHVYEIGLATSFSRVANRIHKDHNLAPMQSSSDEISFNSGSGRGCKIVSQKLFEKLELESDTG